MLGTGTGLGQASLAERKKAANRRSKLPYRLARKISPVACEAAQYRVVLKALFVGLAISGLCSHDAFSLLVAPWLCPIPAAAYLAFRPRRPIRGIPI